MQAGQGKNKVKSAGKQTKKEKYTVFLLSFYLLIWSFKYIRELDWISSLLSKTVLVWGGGG